MVAVDSRIGLRTRDRAGPMTVEMIVTDFEFTPASTVRATLEDLPGVERVDVEPGSGRTVVTFRTAEISLASIIDAVGKAGYFTLIGSVCSA
jgi:copper chaperone CopZ